MNAFTSGDFAKVPTRLQVSLPPRLKHANVLSGTDEEGVRFGKERKHLVKLVDLPSRTLSVTLGGLDPAQASGKHRHNYESII